MILKATGGEQGSSVIGIERFDLLFQLAMKSDDPGSNMTMRQVLALGQTIPSTDGFISRRDWVRWWLRHNGIEEDSSDDDDDDDDDEDEEEEV